MTIGKLDKIKNMDVIEKKGKVKKKWTKLKIGRNGRNWKNAVKMLQK